MSLAYLYFWLEQIDIGILRKLDWQLRLLRILRSKNNAYQLWRLSLFVVTLLRGLQLYRFRSFYRINRYKLLLYLQVPWLLLIVFFILYLYLKQQLL